MALQLFVFLHDLSLAISVYCLVMERCGEMPSWLHLIPNNLNRDLRLARSKLYTVRLGWVCIASSLCVNIQYTVFP